METCIFCQIVEGSIPAERLHEDDQVVVIADAHPHAPVHLLVVPKRHITDIDAVDSDDLLSHLLKVGRRLGNQASGTHGYRITVNGGSQVDIPHLHLHVLGGAKELGPPATGGDTA